MTKNTFRQYRVLGKGGFGEVSNHYFLCIQGTRQPLLPAARGRPGLAIRVPQAAPVPGERCCCLGGLWGALCWAVFWALCDLSALPERQKFTSLQVLEVWELLFRVGSTSPVVPTANRSVPCVSRKQIAFLKTSCQASFCLWNGLLSSQAPAMVLLKTLEALQLLLLLCNIWSCHCYLCLCFGNGLLYFPVPLLECRT